MTSPAHKSPNQSGNDEALSAVNFDIIRYANCWEDAGMLLRALDEKPARNIAIVASAGDNALACLASSPEAVSAFDISLPQLYLSELKQAGFATLDRDELLLLLGIGSSPQQRVQMLDHVAKNLSADCRRYWQDQRAVVSKGLIHGGKFENYFRVFREYLLPLVHSKATLRALFEPKSPAELQRFYRQRWNNFRWRLLMRIFFSRAVMGRAGRDPQFLKQVKIPVADYIRQQTEAHLQSPVAMENHFLQYIFTGNFGPLFPHFLRPELHATIKENISRMTVVQGSADDIVAMRKHDVLCLSNIFEYFPQAQFEGTVSAWKDKLVPGTRMLYWNLMVSRSFASVDPEHYGSGGIAVRSEDAGFFYSAFLNEQRL